MPPSSPVLIAHRGGPRYAPENTLAAFRHALAAGADGVECDVQMTRDGALVILHDEMLERTTNGRGRLAEADLEQVRALDAGRGERIPTLQELLDLTRASGCRLLIELKSPALYPGLEAAVLGLLEASGDLARAHLMSFDFESLQRARQINPDVPLCALVSGWRVDWRRLPAGLHSIGPMAEAVALQPGLVRQAHTLGLQVFVWFGALENRWMYRRLHAAGVDSITGDDPLALIQTLRHPL